MAHITSLKLKSDDTRYTAQIKIKRKGTELYSETKMFAKKHDAQNWVKAREVQIKTKGLPGGEQGMTEASGLTRATNEYELNKSRIRTEYLKASIRGKLRIRSFG